MVVRDLQRLTLDIDATIIPSTKREALPTYRPATGERQGERGHQPLNLFNPEMGQMVYSETRDGKRAGEGGQFSGPAGGVERVAGGCIGGTGSER